MLRTMSNVNGLRGPCLMHIFHRIYKIKQLATVCQDDSSYCLGGVKAKARK